MFILKYSGIMTVCAALVLALPTSTSALSFTQTVGLFHVAVGLLLTATLGMFATGVVLWLSRFNTWPSHRDYAIRVLEWAIAMLFMLIILIALVNFFQNHSEIALPIFAFVVIVAVAIIVIRVAIQPPKKPAPPPPRR